MRSLEAGPWVCMEVSLLAPAGVIVIAGSSEQNSLDQNLLLEGNPSTVRLTLAALRSRFRIAESDAPSRLDASRVALSGSTCARAQPFPYPA